MGLQPNTRPVQVLYIGRVDESHQKLWDQLQRENISIVFVTTQKAGLEKAEALQPQVVVINAIGAQFSADRICRMLARRLPNGRRLIITDRAPSEPPLHDRALSDRAVPDRALSERALSERAQNELEGDLHLVSPFTIQKLRKSLFKLLQASAPPLMEVGPLKLDILAKTLHGPLGEHHLTPKQCHLLAAFMERPNQVISRRDLMGQIWDTAYLGDTRTLDVHIRWLREKIERDPKRPDLLVTKRGVGYVLAIPAPGANGELVEAEPEEVLEVD